MPISRHARMIRTAISPRFAIRTFLNMGGVIVLDQRTALSERAVTSIKVRPLSQEGPGKRRKGLALRRGAGRCLQNDAAHVFLSRFFCFLLAGSHGFVTPLVGNFHVISN